MADKSGKAEKSPKIEGIVQPNTEEQKSHSVAGRETKVGDPVIYSHPYGNKYEGKILEIVPKNDSHHIKVETEVDGQLTHFIEVPYHADGVGHSWKHAE